MSLERDVPRRDRRRRLWPSLFLLALLIWAFADIIFTSYARPESLSPRRMIERHTIQDPIPVKDSRITPRHVFKKLLEEHQFNHSKATWKEQLSEDMDVTAAEKLATLMGLMSLKQVEYAPCLKDETLDPIPDHISDIFVASNLKDNEKILPNMMKHLMLLILGHPEISFFISIYESGSRDGTAAILKAFADVLEILEIEHVVRYNGTLTRRRRQGRIEFLSSVRNAALQPLTTNSSGERWDRILFINDVMFCSDDLHRLLMHDGDIVCGLDFIRHVERPSKRRRKTVNAVDVKRLYYSERLNDIMKKATKVLPSAQRWERPLETTTIDLASTEIGKPTVWMEFYDIWVSHDISGRHLHNDDPLVEKDSYSHQRLQNGLPFPVECCWNGAASLNPEPFIRHNVQFRSALKGECRTSECVLLCHDFQRLGYNRVTIDPSVWLSYTPEDARMLNENGIKGTQRVSWKEVQTAEAMIDVRFPINQTVDCCNIIKNKDIVDFKFCKPNYNFWNVSSAREHLGLVEDNLELIWNTTKK